MEYGNPKMYLYTLITTSMIFVLELISTIYLSKKLLIQYNLPSINKNDRIANLVQHIVLPFSFFIGLSSFMFFYQYSIIKYLFLAASLVIFWILFTNISAYYEDKFKIEIRTHGIYDSLTVLAYFGIFECIIDITYYLNINFTYILVLLSITTLIFCLTIITRLFPANLLKIIPIIVFINVIIYFIGKYFGLESLRISFLSSAVIYFFIAYANHSKENTKSLGVIEEYILLFLIALVILIFN